MADKLAVQSNSSWSGRWYELLDSLGYDLRRGQSFARRGRVQSVEVQIGRILAEVHDRDRGTCPVEINIDPFQDQEWTDVLDRLAGEALYAAQLLAGDMPAAIESVFADAGVHLLPMDQQAIRTACNVCEGWEQPCKHIAAVLYVTGQMIEEDPWLLFRMRGRDRQQVLQGLRQRRNDGSGPSPGLPLQPADEQETGAAAALGTLQKQGDQQPLSSQIDAFWGRSKTLRDLHYQINAPTIRLSLLRRLGRPPFSLESLETYDKLAEIYQQVSDKALELAFAPQPDENDDLK